MDFKRKFKIRIIMNTEKLISKAGRYLNILCREINERSVGTEGNRKATAFFEKEISSLGWETELQEFQAMDWEDGSATLLENGGQKQSLPQPAEMHPWQEECILFP